MADKTGSAPDIEYGRLPVTWEDQGDGTYAIREVNRGYVWDPSGLAWIREQQSGAAGGAGSLTNAELRATPVPVSGSGVFHIDDNAGSITVDGTVAVTQPVAVTDNAGSLTVDGSISVSNFPATQPVSGTVTANAGTGPWPVTDNGGLLSIDDGAGSITVDGFPADQLVHATNLDVALSTRLKPADTLAAVTSITNVVHVDDNAGSITVDGTVAVTQPVAVTDNAGSLTVDGTVTVANPTTNPETGLMKDATFTSAIGTSGVDDPADSSMLDRLLRIEAAILLQTKADKKSNDALITALNVFLKPSQSKYTSLIHRRF